MFVVGDVLLNKQFMLHKPFYKTTDNTTDYQKSRKLVLPVFPTNNDLGNSHIANQHHNMFMRVFSPSIVSFV